MSKTKNCPCGKKRLVVPSVDNLEVLRSLVGAEEGRELGQGDHQVVQHIRHCVVRSNHRALRESIQSTS